VSGLDDVLRLCPASDEEQRQRLEVKYGLRTLDDLSGAIVFGTGLLGTALAGSLQALGLEPLAFSDNDAARWGESIGGLTVLPPASLDRDRPVIVASKFVKDSVAGLREARGGQRLLPHYLLPVLFPGTFPGGFHELSAEAVAAGTAQIEEVFATLADADSRELYLQLLRFRLTLDPLDLPDPTPDQYFPAGFWTLGDHEVYVDVGACEGDTLADFLRRSGGAFDRYYALEPDPRNLESLRRLAAARPDPRVDVVPCGAGERRGTVSFVAGRGGESRVGSDGALTVQIVTLDELLADEPVTTIKIDVEGYERETLRGARDVLERRSPKLAVSVYHMLRDLWEIPAWIAGRRGDYRFYLRHHTAEIYDTVLYCIPGDPATSATRQARTGRP
jgi:FkbM family methyltransferase